jgi:hypothetical protein
MSVIYQADVYSQEDEVIDTLEVGGDDGSLPEIDMGPDTARQELEQLAQRRLRQRGLHRRGSCERINGMMMTLRSQAGADRRTRSTEALRKICQRQSAC